LGEEFDFFGPELELLGLRAIFSDRNSISSDSSSVSSDGHSVKSDPKSVESDSKSIFPDGNSISPDRNSISSDRIWVKSDRNSVKSDSKSIFSDRNPPPEGLLGFAVRFAGLPTSSRLGDHRGAVAEDLGDAVHHLGRVVADSDDGVRPELRRVGDHHLEGLAAGLLAQLGEERDVAAGERLQGAADGAEDRARADRDAAHDTEVADDPMARELEGGRGHVELHGSLLEGAGGAPAGRSTSRS